MKLHNPLKVAIDSHTPVLFITLYVATVVVVTTLVIVLSHYPIFVSVLFGVFFVGRVGYAIIKGE